MVEPMCQYVLDKQQTGRCFQIKMTQCETTKTTKTKKDDPMSYFKNVFGNKDNAKKGANAASSSSSSSSSSSTSSGSSSASNSTSSPNDRVKPLPSRTGSYVSPTPVMPAFGSGSSSSSAGSASSSTNS